MVGCLSPNKTGLNIYLYIMWKTPSYVYVTSLNLPTIRSITIDRPNGCPRDRHHLFPCSSSVGVAVQVDYHQIGEEKTPLVNNNETV